MGIALLCVLFQVDRTAAWWFLPYTIYVIYANAWGYALIRANCAREREHRYRLTGRKSQGGPNVTTSLR